MRWSTGFTYLKRGLAIARHDPLAYLGSAAVYAAPALGAAYLSATVREPSLWQRAVTFSLPWITLVLGTVVVMMIVHHHARGRSVGLGRATWEALPWVPRYLWTNAHTSLIFWVPVGLLLEVRAWQETATPNPAGAGLGHVALWWLVIGGVALYLHTRTLLAPFLAVNADLPGTLATLEAWRLSGRHFGVCVATLLVASAPVVLPIGLLWLALVASLPEPARSGVLGAGPDLVVVGVQAVRPVLIPPLYVLYQDLWQAELARRGRDGGPAVPAFAGALLALTRPLPKLGRWR